MGSPGAENQSTLRAIPKAFNRTLTFACVLIATSQLNFGFEQGGTYIHFPLFWLT